MNTTITAVFIASARAVAVAMVLGPGAAATTHAQDTIAPATASLRLESQHAPPTLASMARTGPRSDAWTAPMAVVRPPTTPGADLRLARSLPRGACREYPVASAILGAGVGAVMGLALYEIMFGVWGDGKDATSRRIRRQGMLIGAGAGVVTGLRDPIRSRGCGGPMPRPRTHPR